VPPRGGLARAAARVLGSLGALLLRLQRATWRSRCEGLDELDRRLASGEPLLVAFWHGKYLPLFALLAGRRAAVLTSRSFRGAVIAEVCRRFGYRPVLVPERGREAVLAVVREALADGGAVGLAADGPLGPRRVFKLGAVHLAAERGCTVLPVGVASRRRRVAATRWDHREVPRLGTQVALVVGAPVRVPPSLDELAAREWSQRLATAIDAADQRAERLAARREGGLSPAAGGSPPPHRGRAGG
jgi:lysophospholipid acyltransferase (LPLAT)-like uncharacterized protein